MSGRTALMNFATKLMRSRTELMFQVVSLSCSRDQVIRDQTIRYQDTSMNDQTLKANIAIFLIPDPLVLV